jgi:hypothetical protein
MLGDDKVDTRVADAAQEGPYFCLPGPVHLCHLVCLGAPTSPFSLYGPLPACGAPLCTPTRFLPVSICCRSVSPSRVSLCPLLSVCLASLCAHVCMPVSRPICILLSARSFGLPCLSAPTGCLCLSVCQPSVCVTLIEILERQFNFQQNF